MTGHCWSPSAYRSLATGSPRPETNQSTGLSKRRHKENNHLFKFRNFAESEEESERMVKDVEFLLIPILTNSSAIKICSNQQLENTLELPDQ